MDIKETLRSSLRDIVLPEIHDIKTEQIKITERLNSVDQRLADINIHLADQSRRIDETNKRIDSVRDELTGRIDSVRDELVSMIGETNKRIDETNNRIDSVGDELVSMIGETNKRIDRLYEVIVRRDEHSEVVIKIIDLEKRVVGLEQRLAA
ncbi:MAG: hypothetical protein J7K15_01400 [Deltaproteobacteria bacterium]|nr:hypothetical protein [Deltaproteobacteria bacterium]